jgi:sec-independent protein translocase protein TatB
VFDIGFGEMLAIAVIGLLVIGPDRLPQYAAKAARAARDLKAYIDKARTEIKEAVNISDLGLDEVKQITKLTELDDNAKRRTDDIT